MPSLTRSNRLGVTSLASILLETSKAIITSIPVGSVFFFSVPQRGRANAAKSKAEKAKAAAAKIQNPKQAKAWSEQARIKAEVLNRRKQIYKKAIGGDEKSAA